MPIEFQVGEGGSDHATTIARARAAYGELQRHTDIPFVRAWELLDPESFALHHWPFPVNFFSYIDFRRTPGGLRHPLWNPTLHVWAARGNGISHWFHRTATGLHVNMLHVDTPKHMRSATPSTTTSYESSWRSRATAARGRCPSRGRPGERRP